MGKVDYGLDKITEFLPHRPPFLFVDRVTELDLEKRVVAELDLRSSEPHFQGHFPQNPVMPGVLITEALAQTAGLLIAFTEESKNCDARGKMFYLAKADMKWMAPAHPGDTLILEAKHVRTLEKLVAFRVRAFTKKADLATGHLTLARVE
jgi:3-hydroxyacyl-[acyl-carrier-protein] dehydratase